MIKKGISLVIIFFILTTVLLCMVSCKSEDLKGNELEVSYEVNCSLDEEINVLYSTCKITILNSSDIALEELPFYLYPNAYQEEGGGIMVSNVSSRTRDLNYNIDNINMVVHLDETLKAGESEEISISSRVSIPKGDGRFGYDEGNYNLHAFYPRLAYFNGSKFMVVPYSKWGDPYFFSLDDFLIKINYPAEYVLAHSGELMSQTENEKSKESVVSIDDARDVALSLSKSFNHFESEVDGIKIYHYTAGEKDYTNFAGQCIRYFNNEIGKYPYSTFTMVETPFEYGGMEYSGLVVINKKAKEKEFIIAHEIIHQWLGLMVGSNSYEECWVDESLTNFLTYYYMDKYSGAGYKEAIDLEKENYKSFIEIGKKKYGIGYTPKLNSNLGEFRTQGEYSNMVYGYGVLLYDGVYGVIGEKKFKRAIKEYYESHAGKISSSEKLINSFNKSAGKKVNGIFNGYLENKVVF